MKNRLFRFFSRLSAESARRGIYPVIAGYALICWVLLQVGEVTFEPLHLPGWVMTGLIVAVILGFPLVVVLAWVFDITPQGIKRDPGATQDDSAANTRPSIAILPFADMSEGQDQGYFCEGIAEEILNALTRIEQLRVVARSSSFQFRADAGDVRRIGKELGVTTILEGSVRKSSNRLRISAQLVNVADGYHLWSGRFDEELKDIFSIQDQIASNIAEALLRSITPKQQAAIKTASSKHVSAYEFYLKGRQFISRFHKIDLKFAQRMFREAIDIDPEFALAWSGYSDCYSLMFMYEDAKERYKTEAQEASEKALDIDPGLAEAHASRGLAHLVAEEFKRAETEFDRALEINPALFEAYYYYGRSRFHQGDLESAAEFFRKASAVDPADYQSRCLRVQILRGAGRLDEAVTEAKSAVAVLRKHLQWNPDDARALHLGAGSLVVLGEHDEASMWLQRALEIDPDDSVLLYNVACNYATMGERDKTLDYLDLAIENGMVNLAWMRNDTGLELIRDDPRFDQLMRRLRAATPHEGAVA